MCVCVCICVCVRGVTGKQVQLDLNAPRATKSTSVYLGDLAVGDTGVGPDNDQLLVYQTELMD